MIFSADGWKQTTGSQYRNIQYKAGKHGTEQREAGHQSKNHTKYLGKYASIYIDIYFEIYQHQEFFCDFVLEIDIRGCIEYNRHIQTVHD